MPAVTKIQIAEAGTSAFRESSQTGSKRAITVIRAGWGSSGYYSEQVLERDIPRIFPAGTHMYLDHPTESEDQARPERSVRDWVGTFDETPRMAGIDSVTVANIFEHWQPVINGIVEGGGKLGTSIRAFGLSEEGAAGGQNGPIIERLTEGLSVDFVTLPGAGGSVGAMTESMRERVIPLIESARLAIPAHLREALDSEVREALDSAGTTAYGSDDVYVYCNDYDIDESWAIFWINPDNAEAYYLKQDFVRNSDGDVALKGEGSKVDRDVNYVPAKESSIVIADEARNAGNYLEALLHRRFSETADNLFGEGHLTREERISLSSAIGDGLQAFAATLESEVPQLFTRDPYADLERPEEEYMQENGGSGRPTEEDKMAEDAGLSELRREFESLKESLNKKVEEAEDRATKAETRADEAEARADRAEEKDLKTEAMKVAAKVLESVGQDKLSTKAKARIIEAATRGDLPMEGDKLDESVLQERTRARAREELEYLGEALGTGRVEGAGGSGDLFQEAAAPGGGGGSEEVTDEALVEAFKRQGMSDEAAKRAAEGR
jgi:hypothetical protein